MTRPIWMTIALVACCACAASVEPVPQGSGEPLVVESIDTGDVEGRFRVHVDGTVRIVHGAILRDYSFARVTTADGEELASLHRGLDTVVVFDGQSLVGASDPAWETRIDPVTRRVLRPEVLSQMTVGAGGLDTVLGSSASVAPSPGDDVGRTTSALRAADWFCNATCYDSLCAACMRKMCDWARCIDSTSCSTAEADRRLDEAECICGSDCMGAVGYTPATRY